MPRTAYTALDVRCPRCNAVPGFRCTAIGQPQRRLHVAHALRTIAARQATAAITGARPTASVSSAWTCPECGTTLWQPQGWPDRVWQAARDAAQILHGRQHRQEASLSDPPDA